MNPKAKEHSDNISDYRLIRHLLQENKRLKERLQVELRASNVLAHDKYPKTDYFSKALKGGE